MPVRSSSSAAALPGAARPVDLAAGLVAEHNVSATVIWGTKLNSW